MRLLAAALVGLGAWLLSLGARANTRASRSGALRPAPPEPQRTLTITVEENEMPLAWWEEAPAATPYLGAIREAETRYGLPSGLLSRIAWQESRWDPTAVSPAGAQGLLQFMPATAADFKVDPFEPESAIDGAARYLVWLRGKLSSWEEALAAYNWGIGNVQRLGLERAPNETREYVRAIREDVDLA